MNLAAVRPAAWREPVAGYPASAGDGTPRLVFWCNTSFRPLGSGPLKNGLPETASQSQNEGVEGAGTCAETLRGGVSWR
jgi:hypothetical protein